MMLRCLAIALLCSFAAAQAAFADTVSLRARVEASGPAITMGDVFDGAPAEIAQRAIAPAPPPGQITQLSVPVLAAAASAAGLEWTPPAGLQHVQVVRPGGARAMVAPTNGGGRSIADAAIRRGELVSLSYEAPGMMLTMRARALEDGAVGQTVRLVNTASNRTIDAVVTGPGAARANP
ncbi:MAG: flagella basal body P-ring formation protein FlgA [Hyphomonadaceae bacterium]|nr:flagella basal body P-ring formation protein FlgA [Hyphomonadaceae bacterium]